MAADRLAALESGRVRAAVLVCAGALLSAAYPTLDWWPVAWVALVPLLASALVAPPRRALAEGWLMGTVFFLFLLRWLDHTFRNYSAIPWPLTWLPLLGLAAYCGFYYGLIAAAVARLRLRLGAGWALALAPFLWVTGEWLRGWLLSGFPWGLLGYSQYRVLPVIQIASATGVYGVSFAIVAVNAALVAPAALGWRPARPGLAGTAALLVGTLGFGVLELAPSPSPPAPRLRIAVIQPSIEQTLKWDPVHHRETMAIYTGLTREAGKGNPAIILWPETAAPIFLRRDPALVADLTGLAAEVKAPLLVGSLDGDTRGFFNSAFLLTGRGITAKYDKIHLVPFGEYVPLVRLIGFVRSWAEFISEFQAGTEPTVFQQTDFPFGVVICYEGIFPELFREFMVGGARYMVNITNDAWFGTTSGPWQHLSMLPLRAVEHRVSIARAANTGVSAFVDASGRITRTLGLFERGVLSGEVVPRRGRTLYTRVGDLFAFLCVAASAVAVLLAGRRRLG